MFKRQIISRLTTLFAGVIFSLMLLGVLTHATWLSQFNHAGQTLIQLRSPMADTFFMTITQMGSVFTATVLTTLLVICLFIWRQFRWGWFLTVNVAGCAGCVTYLIKNWVRNPRPQPQLLPETGYSFPSGHSMVAVLLYGSCIVLAHQMVQTKWLRQIITWSFGSLIGLIAISRVYLNVHYLSDVIAGLSLAWLLLQLSYVLLIGEKHAANHP